LVRSFHCFKRAGSAATIERVLALSPGQIVGSSYCVADSSRSEFRLHACAGGGWVVISTPPSYIATNCRANNITAASSRSLAADIDTRETFSHPEHTICRER
jgi:hypothetical protein